MADIVDRPGSIRRFIRPAADHPILLAWAGVTTVLVASWTLGFSPNSDLDDLLKLVKIRSFLSNGAWFDQTIPGILQPEPFVSHWPRLLDLPYALLAWAVAPLTDPGMGLTIAAFAVPLLLLLPALVSYRKIVGALGFRRPNAAFVLALIPALRAFFEFAPDRIDYHNIQIVLVLASIALTFSEKRLAAAVNGAVAALAMAMSIEFALVFALVMAVHAVEFIFGDEDGRRRLGQFGATLAVTALLAYAATVAPGSYGAVACDSYSTPHLVAFLVAGATFAGAAAVGHASLSRLLRALLIVIPAVLGLVLLLGFFPQCLAGPYAGLTPYLRDVWLLEIPQERSLFARPEFVLSADMASVTLLLVGAAAPAAVVTVGGVRDRNFVLFALFALLAMLQAIFYFRYVRYLPIFAAPGLLLALAALFPGLGAKRAMLANRFRNGASPSVAPLAPGLFVSAALISYHAVIPAAIGQPTGAGLAESCDVEAIAADWPAGARIMAPPAIGIQLLPNLSGVTVVAVPYHTGAPGVERAYRFLDPATDDPRAMLDDARATHVAVCAWPGEPSAALEKQYPFAVGLMNGLAPAWLVECPAGRKSPLRIYRYAAAAGAGQSCPTER